MSAGSATPVGSERRLPGKAGKANGQEGRHPEFVSSKHYRGQGGTRVIASTDKLFWPWFCKRVQSQGKGEAMNAAAVIDRGTFRSSIPSRLDRLPWSRWHWRVVLALGITWVIDGLEVTLVGAVSPVLQRPDTLGFSSSQNGLLNTAYLVRGRHRVCWFFGLSDRPLGTEETLHGDAWSCTWSPHS